MAFVRSFAVCSTLIVLALFLGACGTVLNWQWKVTCVHDLDDVRGKTFTIVPLRTELEGSAEFAEFAKQVVQRLVQRGMIHQGKEETGKTDFLVGLDYHLGQPYVERSTGTSTRPSGSTPATISGGQAATPSSSQGGGNQRLSVLSPGLGTGGQRSGGVNTRDIYITTLYPQSVRISIFNSKKIEGKLIRRYEAKASANGTNHDLAQIVSSGITVLLTDFPGDSDKSGRL